MGDPISLSENTSVTQGKFSIHEMTVRMSKQWIYVWEILVDDTIFVMKAKTVVNR